MGKLFKKYNQAKMVKAEKKQTESIKSTTEGKCKNKCENCTCGSDKDNKEHRNND